MAFAGITKRFPGVVALDDVSFEVAPASCHAVCGENGAGKSTLSKLLAGIQRPDAGTIGLAGAPVALRHARATPSPPASRWCTRNWPSATT